MANAELPHIILCWELSCQDFLLSFYVGFPNGVDLLFGCAEASPRSSGPTCVLTRALPVLTASGHISQC